jgi:hypothetical protein
MATEAEASGRAGKVEVWALLERIPLRIERSVVIGSGLGDEDLIADFVLHGSPKYSEGLAVKVRSQRGSGTVDEKLYALCAAWRSKGITSSHDLRALLTTEARRRRWWEATP